jgi:hypothetical protein
MEVTMKRPFGVLTFVSVFLLAFPAAPVSEIGAYGYATGGLGASQCASGCPPTGPVYEQVLLIGGGFAYPISRGRLWIAGDVNSRAVGGYFDASGGPAAIVSLSPREHQLEFFAQAGPRWGDGGSVRWNAGGGVNVFSKGRLGLRLEYQFQWQNATWVDQQYGPSGPIGPPTYSNVRLIEQFLRAGITIR